MGAALRALEPAVEIDCGLDVLAAIERHHERDQAVDPDSLGGLIYAAALRVWRMIAFATC